MLFRSVMGPVEVGMVMSRLVVCSNATFSELNAVAVTEVGWSGWLRGRDRAGTMQMEEPVSVRPVLWR